VPKLLCLGKWIVKGGGIRRKSMIVIIGVSGEEGECKEDSNINAGDRRRKDENLENE